MKKIILIISLIALFVSCKTVEKPKEIIKIDNLVKQNFSENVFIRTKIKPEFPEMSQSFTANININGLDSIGVNIYGPFGISIGRLFATKDEFIFFNTFENSIYKGKPNAENLKKVTGLDLDYLDLIKILRLSVPAKLDEFRLDSSYSSEGKMLFKRIHTFPEFILYSGSIGKITQYQRKNSSNENTMTIAYKDFKSFEIGEKPAELLVSLPHANGQIKLNIDEYKIENTKDRLSFSYPSNIKVVNLEQ